MVAQATDELNRGSLHFGGLGDKWVHLCVDMQRMFSAATAWQAPWFARVLPQIVQLAEAAPERTLFTRFIPPVEAEDMWGTWQRYYRRWPTMTRTVLQPDMLDLVPELGRFVPPALVVDKAIYSPWLGSRLGPMLNEKHVDTVIVSGGETEVCVLATVMGAIDLGYRVILVTDAVCSSADSTHDAMMHIYESRFGMQVETAQTAEVVAAMRQVR